MEQWIIEKVEKSDFFFWFFVLFWSLLYRHVFRFSSYAYVQLHVYYICIENRWWCEGPYGSQCRWRRWTSLVRSIRTAPPAQPPPNTLRESSPFYPSPNQEPELCARRSFSPIRFATLRIYIKMYRPFL